MNFTGMIGVSSSIQSRYSEFWDSLIHIDCGVPIKVEVARGANIAENRNGLTEHFLECGAEWIFYVDDDQIFAPSILKDLLAHDLPVVSGLYVQRQVPFQAHIYDMVDERGYQGAYRLQPSDQGLIRGLLSTGAGALLVRKEVIQALEKPYWTLGQIDKVNWSDDFDFFRRVREKGFDVACDLRASVGHKVEGTLWPELTPQGWITTLVIGNIPVAHFPQMQSPLSINRGGKPRL